MTTFGLLREFGIRIEGPEDGDYDDLVARALEAACDAVEDVLRGTDLNSRWRSYGPPWVYAEPES